MRRIKICFTSLYAYHLFNPQNKSRFGGAEVQLYYLATELAKDPEFDISFIVGDFGQPEFEIRQGVKLYKFFNPIKKIKYLRGIFAIGKLISLLYKIKADIYIQRSAGLETGIVALFCKLFRKKFVYMSANDEDFSKKKPSYFPKGLISFLRWKLFQLGIKYADLIFVQNQVQEKLLEKNYKKKGVIRKSGFPIFLPEKVEKDYILWVGKADKKTKFPELFLQLAKELPQSKFVMICPESSDRNYFLKIKQNAQKIKNLKFIDYVPFNEIDKYFQQAKILVNTSLTEGFPNVFIQSAKNQTPIVSFKINPDNFLEKFNIGRSAYGSFEKLKEIILTILENQKLWRILAQNAYQYAKENHNLEKIVKKDKLLLKKLIKTENA